MLARRWTSALIPDLKDLTEWRMLALTTAIFLVTLGVLVIRYGHVRYPYLDDAAPKGGKAYVRE